MLSLVVFFVCCSVHLYLSRRQEMRHKNKIKTIRRLVVKAAEDKVIALTLSRRNTRKRARRCDCLGDRELRNQRKFLVDDIIGPMDRYLADEMNQNN